MQRDFIQKLTGLVEANLANENFGPEELARGVDMSQSNLLRKLKSIDQKTISQFIREVRLNKARELLQNEELTAAEVSYRVGFGSPTYFNKCFHEYFGFAPGELRIKDSGNDTEIKPVEIVQKKKAWKKFLVVIIIGLIEIIPVSYFLIQKVGISGVVKDKSIAILPFKNLSEDKENQYFADGITQDILNLLLQIKDFRVVSRISAEQLEDIGKTDQEIARKLGVSYILEGSVQRYEDKVRIMVQLIDISKGHRIVMAEKYDRDFADIFMIQSSIAKQVADQLEAVLSPGEIKSIEEIHTQNTEAYNLYLKGRFFWNKRTQDGIKGSIEYFKQAVEIDPKYALAWCGLADGYSILTGYGWFTPKKEGQEIAKKYILTALKLDDKLAEAHAALGRMLIYHDRNWGEAEKELTLAISLSPKYAPAHQYYSQLLDIFGESQNAREQADIAIELDPLSVIIHHLSATLYYNERNFNKALKEYQEVLTLEKNYESAYWERFLIYFRQGNGPRALDELHNIFHVDSLETKYGNAADIEYAKSGLKGLTDWLIEITQAEAKLKRTGNLAGLYAITGKTEEALTCIKNYINNGSFDDIVRLINKLDYESLRSEPGFRLAIEELGLSKYYARRIIQTGYINNL